MSIELNIFSAIGIYEVVRLGLDICKYTTKKLNNKLSKMNSKEIKLKKNGTYEEFRSERIRRDEIIRSLLAHGYEENEIKDMFGDYLGREDIREIIKKESKANRGAVA